MSDLSNCGTPSWRRAIPALFLFLFAGLPGGAQAQRFPPDPVDELRQALRNDHDAKDEAALKYRANVLEKRTAALNNLGDMSQALLLLDWRYEDFDERVAKIDQRAWDDLAKRFKDRILEVMKNGEPARRWAAANLIGEMGQRSQQIREMASLTKQTIPRGEAQPAIPTLSPAVLTPFTEPLAQLTRSDQPALAEAAARALGRINPLPKIAVPALKALLEKGTVGEQRAAAEALGNLVRVASQVEKIDRSSIGLDLRKDLAAMTSEVVPVAGAALRRSSDVEVRRFSLQAIQLAAISLADVLMPPAQPSEFPPSDRPPTREERERIADYRRRMEEQAQIIAPLADALKGQTDLIARLVRDPDPALGLLACHTLEDIATARQKLQQSIQSMPALPNEEKPDNPGKEGQPKPQARSREGLPEAAPLLLAVAAQAGPGPDAPLLDPRALQDLAAGTTDRDVRVRLAAIDALEELGTAAQPVAAALVRALNDCDLFVRWAAARTLGKLEQALAAQPPEQRKVVESAVPALVRLLDDPDLGVRMTAAEALGRYGPAANAAVPALARAVAEGDVEMRIAAIQALGGIGERSAEAVPELIQALNYPDARLRLAAAKLFGQLGPLARGRVSRDTAIQALRNALNDPDNEVRLAVSDAFLKVTREP
jgi:HEAT repeat protein